MYTDRRLCDRRRRVRATLRMAGWKTHSPIHIIIIYVCAYLLLAPLSFMHPILFCLYWFLLVFAIFRHAQHNRSLGIRAPYFLFLNRPLLDACGHVIVGISDRLRAFVLLTIAPILFQAATMPSCVYGNLVGEIRGSMGINSKDACGGWNRMAYTIQAWKHLHSLLRLQLIKGAYQHHGSYWSNTCLGLSCSAHHRWEVKGNRKYSSK